MQTSSKNWPRQAALTIAAALFAGDVAAQCLSYSDVLSAEDAATNLASGNPVAAAEAADQLNRRLDLLAALYPDANGDQASSMGAYIASRRTLALIHSNLGAEAARAYAADPGFAAPMALLTSVDGEASCEDGRADATGAGAGAPGDEEIAGGGGLGGLADRVGGGGLRPIQQINVNFDNIETPPPITLIGAVTLLGLLFLIPITRRRDRRFVCHEPIMLNAGAGDVGAVAVNISRSGMKIRTSANMKRNQEIRIRVAGAVYTARVRWARRGHFGLEFGGRLKASDFARFLKHAAKGAGAAELEMENEATLRYRPQM